MLSALMSLWPIALHGCGMQSLPPAPLKPGDYSRTIEHDGLTREYLLHVPPQYDGSQPLPLVLMFHGGFGTADDAGRRYGWREKADAEGFFAVFPQGIGLAPTWNAVHCCGAALRSNVDDVGFVMALLDSLSAELRIDATRIYAAGMSNGAMFCHRLAAERGDRIAAIAPVAGTIGGQADVTSPVEKPVTPKQPVAVIIFHGVDDQHVLFLGGPSIKGAVPGRVDISAEESAQFWAQANGTATQPTRVDLANDMVHRSTWADPTGVADVILYAVEGQGHAWPGGVPRIGGDPPSRAIDATAVAWDFFMAHPKR